MSVSSQPFALNGASYQYCLESHDWVNDDESSGVAEVLLRQWIDSLPESERAAIARAVMKIAESKALSAEEAAAYNKLSSEEHAACLRALKQAGYLHCPKESGVGIQIVKVK